MGAFRATFHFIANLPAKRRASDCKNPAVAADISAIATLE